MFGLITRLNAMLIKSVEIPEEMVHIAVALLKGGSGFADIFENEATHAVKMHNEESKQDLKALEDKSTEPVLDQGQDQET
jgi:hypothetical protein